MKNTQQTTKLLRWPYVLAAAVSMLFAGIIYAWSILKAPLVAEFGWKPSQLALNFTLTMCFFCIGGIVSGFALKRFSPKVIIIAAGVLVCAGFVISSQLSGSIAVLYLAYGVLGGTGIGMAYNAVISTTNAWFPDKKGLVSGIQMMSFGASSLVLGNLAGYFISAPGIGWRTTYVFLGCVTGAVLLVAGFLMKLPPKGTVFPAPKALAKKNSENFESKDYTTGEMIRRFSFWRFFLFSIALAAIGNTVISLARDLAQSVGAGAALATTLVGVLSICNGLGRLLSGFLFDNIGRKRTMITANVINIAAPVVTLFAILGGSLPLCIAGLCLTGLSYGFAPPISSAFTMAFYGPKNFATNFSISNTMLIPASFVATLAGSMISASGSYVSTFVMLIGFSVVSLILNLSIRKP